MVFGRRYAKGESGRRGPGAEELTLGPAVYLDCRHEWNGKQVAAPDLGKLQELGQIESGPSSAFGRSHEQPAASRKIPPERLLITREPPLRGAATREASQLECKFLELEFEIANRRN
jgi:hypothetical protein